MGGVRWPLLCVFGLVACGADSAITFPNAGIPADQLEVANRAFGALIAACPGIKRYRNDYEPVAMRRVEASMTDQRERGWHRVTEFEIRVIDKPSGDPLRFRAAGHSCWYVIGDGAPVGVATAKRPCVALCAGSEGGSEFAPLPTGG